VQPHRNSKRAHVQKLAKMDRRGDIRRQIPFVNNPF
jgi:hypothetical protein